MWLWNQSTDMIHHWDMCISPYVALCYRCVFCFGTPKCVWKCFRVNGSFCPFLSSFFTSLISHLLPDPSHSSCHFSSWISHPLPFPLCLPPLYLFSIYLFLFSGEHSRKCFESRRRKVHRNMPSRSLTRNHSKEKKKLFKMKLEYYISRLPFTHIDIALYICTDFEILCLLCLDLSVIQPIQLSCLGSSLGKWVSEYAKVSCWCECE